MEQISQWLAPIATTIGAIMVAGNFGTKITGYGFVVFCVGSVGWILMGIAQDNPQLVWSNAFLLLVNGVGVWRWLGLRARYDKAAQAATQATA